jgi:hypothetical protein
MARVKVEYTGPGTPRTIMIEESEVKDLLATKLWKKTSTKKSTTSDEQEKKEDS